MVRLEDQRANEGQKTREIGSADGRLVRLVDHVANEGPKTDELGPPIAGWSGSRTRCGGGGQEAPGDAGSPVGSA